MPREEISPLILELAMRRPEGESKSWGDKVRKWAKSAESVSATVHNFLSGITSESLKTAEGWTLIKNQGLDPQCALDLLTSLAKGKCSPEKVFLGRVALETTIPTILAFVNFYQNSWVTKIQHRELLDRGQQALGLLGGHVRTLDKWATFQPEGAQNLMVQVAPQIAGEIIIPPYPSKFVEGVTVAMIKAFCGSYDQVSRSGEIPVDFLIAGNVLWHDPNKCCVVIDADIKRVRGKIPLGQNVITGRAAEMIFYCSCKLAGGGKDFPISYFPKGISYSPEGKKLTFDPSILTLDKKS